MPDFTITSNIPFSPEEVYTGYRDRLIELVPYLPNVDFIHELERASLDDGTVEILNKWNSESSVPRVVRKFVKKEWTEWLDHATWKLAEMTCHWRLEFPAFGEGVDCQGVNYYKETPDGMTEVLFTGRLTLDLKKIPQVPRMARGFGPRIEKFVLERIKPNMISVSAALTKFLQEQGP